MQRIEKDLEKRLRERKRNGTFRSLVTSVQDDAVGDFTSNDYLGFARNSNLIAMIRSEELKYGSNCSLGSTGSRLLSGNSYLFREIETFLAHFHQAQDALLLNSGFDANLGLFSSISKECDAFVYDELIHASVHMGMKSGRSSNLFPFKHNSVDSLLSVIQTFYASTRDEPSVFVAVESIYSMDGTLCKLAEMISVVREAGFDNVHFIVDEAHSTGVRGNEGRGLVQELGLTDQVFARVHTFGKALGCHGAVIVGPTVLKEYLINYAKPLVFSTSLPNHSLVSIQCAYRYLIENFTPLSTRLSMLISHFRQSFRGQTENLKTLGISLLESNTAIQGLIVPGNHNCIQVATIARNAPFHLDVRPIRFPTVTKGMERIRICIHAHNSISEIDRLVEGLFFALRSLSRSKTGPAPLETDYNDHTHQNFAKL